jgi:rhodanese-related sulfurtransferase
VKTVTPEQAYQLQSEGYTYVDVRSVPEYEQGHPAGAVNVPLLHYDPHRGGLVPNPDFLRVMQASFPPESKLLMGCQVGGRSAQAAHMLGASGYTDVSNVTGGFGGLRDPYTGQLTAPGWVQAQLPVETDAPAGGSYDELARKAGGGDRETPR